MRHVITCVSRISALVGTRSVLAVGLGLSMACSVYAEDVTVSEKSFSCLRDGTKIRNTYIKNADPEKLKEAVRIFQNRVPDVLYRSGPLCIAQVHVLFPAREVLRQGLPVGQAYVRFDLAEVAQEESEPVSRQPGRIRSHDYIMPVHALRRQ